MEVPREREHFLALKVMRLTKPSLINIDPLPCEANVGGAESIESALYEAAQRDAALAGASPALPSTSLGHMLSLPQSFGNIFLGQTFSSYISVHNDSQHTVTNVSVKAELQTQSQRLSLSGRQSRAGSVATSPAPGPGLTGTSVCAELGPDRSVDDIIHHEVKELGTHILVCSVTYTTPSNENLFFRKFFKFQVFKPLDVKTKFYNAENNEVYLEAQVENITELPMCMDKVTLEPSSLYTVTPVNSKTDQAEKESSIFGQLYLSPQDVRQYLYCLRPKREHLINNKLYKGVNSIGKLDISWKSAYGERGRLQTSQLQRMAPGYGDIRVTIESIPHTVYILEPFDVVCHITNCCERTMQLQLHVHNPPPSDQGGVGGLQWTVVSGRHLGQLLPNSYLQLTLTAVPLATGIQSVSGIRLTDTFLNRTYEYDDIIQVYVDRRTTREHSQPVTSNTET